MSTRIRRFICILILILKLKLVASNGRVLLRLTCRGFSMPMKHMKSSRAIKKIDKFQKTPSSSPSALPCPKWGGKRWLLPRIKPEVAPPIQSELNYFSMVYIRYFRLDNGHIHFYNIQTGKHHARCNR